ncbi:hypothetical protein EJB05_54780, partial [Eragrostis curvula]
MASRDDAPARARHDATAPVRARHDAPAPRSATAPLHHAPSCTMNSLLESGFCHDSSSDDDDDDADLDLVAAMLVNIGTKKSRKRGGSVIGREIVPRKRQAGHDKLWDDYFSENPIYGHNFFRGRFRMSKRLFLRIASAVEEHCDYFVQKRNAAGELGHSCLKKVAAAIRMLGTGCSADFIDDWLYMVESTIIESLRMFMKSVVEIFGEQYLRAPNEEDTARLMQMGEDLGFPGMLGSIDCMHWRSPLFARLAAGKAPPVNYEVNGHQYDMPYYLADGIYPSWSTFVKTISKPLGNKRIHFAKTQESVRKGVERAFGVLQARWAIVRGPARFWDQHTLCEKGKEKKEGGGGIGRQLIGRLLELPLLIS